MEKEKKVEILISGYGWEIVQGTFTDEEVEILENKMEETDESLASVVLDIQEILPDSYDWYERDDLGHHYGANANSCRIEIISNDESSDITKSQTYESIYELEEEGAYIEYNETDMYDETKNMITTVSTEKGLLFESSIILPSNESFDIKKLQINVNGIIFDEYENETISGVFYDGEEIHDEGCETTGKGVDSFLDKKINSND